jgi:hypothetical protein
LTVCSARISLAAAPTPAAIERSTWRTTPALRGKVGRADQLKLDEYFDSVRAVETDRST